MNIEEVGFAVIANQNDSLNTSFKFYFQVFLSAIALPNIHHDVDTMNEIRNALNAGKEVITRTDAVSVPGWSGAGYYHYRS